MRKYFSRIFYILLLFIVLTCFETFLVFTLEMISHNKFLLSVKRNGHIYGIDSLTYHGCLLTIALLPYLDVHMLQ